MAGVGFEALAEAGAGVSHWRLWRARSFRLVLKQTTRSSLPPPPSCFNTIAGAQLLPWEWGLLAGRSRGQDSGISGAVCG